MGEFSGFPAKTSYVPLPAIFFSTLLPEITDITELRVTLYVVSTLYQKRGYPRFVTKNELLDNTSLRKSLAKTGEPAEKTLSRGLDLAVKRGTIIHVGEYDIYLLNTEADREVADKIRNGEISIPNMKKKETIEPEKGAETPDIFTVYEENIGMLTPLISEELNQAERLYPTGWVTDAIKEAASLNKRNWRYISRILERWQQEGRSDGTPRQDSKKTDLDRYVKQKYGHMFRR